MGKGEGYNTIDVSPATDNWLAISFVVPRAGVEPARVCCPGDFKSPMSTIPSPRHFSLCYHSIILFIPYVLFLQVGPITKLTQ